MSQLRKKMLRDMQLRNFSPKTQKGYVTAVAGLAKYYHQSPATISPEQIQDYIVHLLTEREFAVGSCHTIATGLRFFYTVTLGQDKSSVPIPPIKSTTSLPEILSSEELKKLFVAVRNPKHRAILMTTYGSGLRVWAR